MYKQFFGLRANPFNVNPDPRFLFLTQHAKEALACLTYGIQTRKGFVLLTGEVGTGKTTLLNKMQDWLMRQRVKTAFIFNPRLDAEGFLDFMMTDFGIPGGGSGPKSQVLFRLNQWLLERFRSGETAVLIVDEAQNLTAEVLEEIRLLTNLETSTEKLLQIVLSGQPELESKLNTPELRQLRQRITLRCRTHALTLEETRSYVQQRLTIAGAQTQIFSPEAIENVHLFARGIPRVTNLLCEHALISAFADQQKVISGEVVEAVAREFDLHEIAPTAALQTGLSSGENLTMMDALKNLNTLAERLRREQLAIAEAKGTGTK